MTLGDLFELNRDDYERLAKALGPGNSSGFAPMNVVDGAAQVEVRWALSSIRCGSERSLSKAIVPRTPVPQRAFRWFQGARIDNATVSNGPQPQKMHTPCGDPRQFDPVLPPVSVGHIHPPTLSVPVALSVNLFQKW